MRLTVRLLKGHRSLKNLSQRKWNEQFSFNARIYEKPFKVPESLAQKGVAVTDPLEMLETEYNTVEPFVPPVPDDPRWATVTPLEDRTDWKDNKAYSFNFDEQMYEGVTQACLIAKAQHFDHLPPALEGIVGTVPTPHRDQLLQQAIMLSQVWHTDNDALPRRHPHPDHMRCRRGVSQAHGISYLKSSEIMLRALLRLCKNRLSDFPSLTRRMHVWQPLLHSHVMYQGKPIVQRDTLDCVVVAPSPLGAFADSGVVEDSKNYQIPDMWPVFPTVDFTDTNNYELKDVTGPSSPTHHPHTLVQIPRSFNWKQRTFDWTDDQFLGSSIMTCLMHCAGRARQKYGADVSTLPQPISITHVCLLPTHYLLTCFQLNTLDLDSDIGIKNLVWTSRRCQLFEKLNAEPWHGFENEHKERLRDFNGDAFEPLLAAYLNGCTEVKTVEQQLKQIDQS